jgi:hypothetical protein
MARYRIKPSKPTAVLGMVVGIVFIGLGLFVIIPMFGAFGIFWTLVAAAITVFNAVNAFSDKGIATTEIVADRGDPSPAEEVPFDERLRRLQQLKADGLITEDEFQAKRTEMLNERW